jgi:hypothetical protein
MLIPRYFRLTRWLLVIPLGAAAVGYLATVRGRPEGLTGGSTPGLWFGVLGLACFVWAFFGLAWQRRLERAGTPGRPRAYWLQGHFWIALLGTALILCHTNLCQGGTRLGGRLEAVLMLALGGTLLTGFVGMGLQHIMPGRLPRDQYAELPIAQVHQVCAGWKRQADDLIDHAGAELKDKDRAEQLERVYRATVRPYLEDAWPRRTPLSGPAGQEQTGLETAVADAPEAVQADLRQVRDLCLARRDLLRQQRRHWWLHSWLLLHVPLAVALLALGIVHALASVLF